MGLLTKMLAQRCVYWEPNGVDQYGQTQFKDPVELKCRWEDVMSTTIGAGGETLTSRATVYVGEDLPSGGFLMPGSTDDYCRLTKFPNEYPTAFRILSVSKLGNIKATKFLRTIKL